MKILPTLVAVVCGHASTRSLYTDALVLSPRPIKRVAIIGSGIAGLTTAHALTNILDQSDLKISIYDARSGLDPSVGAGIQLNGGLKVLGDINPSLQQAVIQAGMPMQTIQSRTRTDDDSKQLETLIQLPLKETIQKAGAKQLLAKDGSILWTSIMRGALQQVLHDKLPKSIRVSFRKELIQLLVDDKDQTISCSFKDGTTTGPFDLIIGCDGIKSVVKEMVDYGRIEQGSTSSYSAGLYTGIRIRYAVQGQATKKTSTTSPITFTQYFGNGCYCLDGTYGDGNVIAKSVFSIFLDDDYFGPFRKRQESRATDENADWSQDNFKMGTEAARNVMLRQLEESNLDEESLVSTIEKADRFFELGVYAHNPFCKWSKQIPGSDGVYAVLCGDAAHALPPFLGQGSNQAIQDAYCLATRIQQYNQAVKNRREDGELSLSTYLDDYESVRWMPNFQIFWKAAFLGYLETGGFKGAYSKFRNVFFKAMGVIGVAQRVLLGAATPKV